MTMDALTPPQALVLGMIRAFTLKNGYPPQRQEIATELGRGVTTVDFHLRALASKGYVEIVPLRTRGIKLLDIPTFGELAQEARAARAAARSPAAWEKRHPLMTTLIRVADESSPPDGDEAAA